MAPNVNDIFRVAARLKDTNQNDVVNVFHVRLDVKAGGLTDANVLTHMGAYMEEIYSRIDDHIHSEAQFYDINVFNVTQNSPLGTALWPTLGNGGGAGDPLPSQVSAMLRGSTGKSRNWARKFFGPFTEAMNTTEGFIATTLTTALAAAGGYWLAGYSSGGSTYVPVVWHHRDELWRQITAGIVRNVWSTIRRRRFGRGV